MSLQPPDEALFASLGLAERDVESFALRQGYAMSRLRSKKDKDCEVRKIWLCCVHGRKPRERSTLRVRLTGTRSTGCTWSVTIRRTPAGWSVHVVHVACQDHNHPPAQHPEAYPSARRLSEEEVGVVRELSLAGARPKVTVTALRAQRSEVSVLSRDVYNERHREEVLQGRSPIEALLDDLRIDGTMHNVQVDDANRVTHLFFALPQGVGLARQHGSVVLMDSTYKTNRFKLPLLHVVGAAATNQSFSTCFCFMKGEREADYAWALSCVKRCFTGERHPRVVVTDRELVLLSAVQSVFPSAVNILCSWHIEKNILATVKKNFATEQRYHDWVQFQASYVNDGSTIQYLAATWIVHKEKFVLPWTKRVMHYGHLVTSRVEGNHSMLKGWVAASTGGLGRVVERAKLATEHRVREIAARIAYERSTTLFACKGHFWSGVQRRVSHYALRTVAQQLAAAAKVARGDVKPTICSDSFTSTLGLPCLHRLSRCIVEDRPLQLDDFDAQWHLRHINLTTNDVTDYATLNFDATLENLERFHGALLPHRQPSCQQWVVDAINSFETCVRDPATAHTRGRPAASTTTTSRDASAFERLQSGAVRKCRICHCAGHNRRTCPRRSLDLV